MTTDPHPTTITVPATYGLEKGQLLKIYIPTPTATGAKYQYVRITSGPRFARPDEQSLTFGIKPIPRWRVALSGLASLLHEQINRLIRP